MRAVSVAVLSALILFGSLLVFSQDASVVTIDYPLTAEEEWSNAMIHADRLVVELALGTAEGAGALGLFVWAVIAGFDMLLSLEEPGMLRAGTGLVMIFGGTLWARAAVLWVGLAGIQLSMSVEQRAELLALGRSREWERQNEIIYPEDPDAGVRVDPDNGDPGYWLEWFIGNG